MYNITKNGLDASKLTKSMLRKDDMTWFADFNHEGLEELHYFLGDKRGDFDNTHEIEWDDELMQDVPVFKGSVVVHDGDVALYLDYHDDDNFYVVYRNNQWYIANEEEFALLK